MAGAGPGSIFDLARDPPARGRDSEALRRMYDLRIKEETAPIGRTGLHSLDKQVVVSVTNRYTFEQTWFNAVRGSKPQTFRLPEEPRGPAKEGVKVCDFCEWGTYTAVDTFGRIERQHAVAVSNLFKYCSPCHGVVLFKHHDPLAFSQEQLADLLAASSAWLCEAADAHPDAVYPLLVWNSGPRAGASQFHGHAQVMLSKATLPAYSKLQQAAHMSALSNGRIDGLSNKSVSFFCDLLQAHRGAGLLRVVEKDEGRCALHASLTPVKDMEVILWGTSLVSPAFQAGLHAVLRALIDDMGVRTFNVAILGMHLGRCTGSVEGLSWWETNVGKVMAR
ncbi:unnamed protein product [Ostreobium quekettii]|uniref:Uncharacterized protein n=1 Tax=Ostreobium quekettii TaxID=121088 RepID=A0A8S1IWK3_9CHLO|nr:unnamed protein product [Ostreobium quekettii]